MALFNGGGEKGQNYQIYQIRDIFSNEEKLLNHKHSYNWISTDDNFSIYNSRKKLFIQNGSVSAILNLTGRVTNGTYAVYRAI